MEEEQNSINDPISYQLDRKQFNTTQYSDKSIKYNNTILTSIGRASQHYLFNQHLKIVIITLISIGKGEYNNYSSYREITINNEGNNQIGIIIDRSNEQFIESDRTTTNNTFMEIIILLKHISTISYIPYHSSFNTHQNSLAFNNIPSNHSNQFNIHSYIIYNNTMDTWTQTIKGHNYLPFHSHKSTQ